MFYRTGGGIHFTSGAPSLKHLNSSDRRGTLYTRQPFWPIFSNYLLFFGFLCRHFLTETAERIIVWYIRIALLYLLTLMLILIILQRNARYLVPTLFSFLQHRNQNIRIEIFFFHLLNESIYFFPFMSLRLILEQVFHGLSPCSRLQ